MASLYHKANEMDSPYMLIYIIKISPKIQLRPFGYIGGSEPHWYLKNKLNREGTPVKYAALSRGEFNGAGEGREVLFESGAGIRIPAYDSNKGSLTTLKKGVV